MKNTYLNTDKIILLITFMWKGTDKKFMCYTEKEFMHILKTYDQNGIENIKQFNPIKNTFIRISKKQILAFFSWDTETSEYLKKHYYFK